MTKQASRRGFLRGAAIAGGGAAAPSFASAFGMCEAAAQSASSADAITQPAGDTKAAEAPVMLNMF